MASFPLLSKVQKCNKLFRQSNIIFMSTKIEIDELVHDTGAFKSRLPNINLPLKHYTRAQKLAWKEVKLDYTIKNVRNSNRKFAAQSLDSLMKGLTVPITAILNSYKQTLRTLHPYEATVANLTIIARTKAGNPNLEFVLGNLKTLRTSTSRLAKEFASKANNASSALEAREILEAGQTSLKELYESSEADALVQLLEIQKDLRRIPVVELETPTVVLVGAPNVGKSSIVRAVSSGTPEVNDYPFTTRGVTIGHIVDERRDLRIQVMDTPGLLDRPAEERNEMEKLTFASLAHLPTAVIYVIDPTGLSGEKSTLEAQLNVRTYLKSRFPKRPWIDVVSKSDIEIPDEILRVLPENHLRISVKTGHNIDELKSQLEEMIFKLLEVLNK